MLWPTPWPHFGDNEFKGGGGREEGREGLVTSKSANTNKMDFQKARVILPAPHGKITGPPID